MRNWDTNSHSQRSLPFLPPPPLFMALNTSMRSSIRVPEPNKMLLCIPLKLLLLPIVILLCSFSSLLKKNLHPRDTRLDNEIKDVKQSHQVEMWFQQILYATRLTQREGSLARADLASGPLAIYLKVNPTAHQTPLMVSKQHEEQSCLPSLRLHFFFSAVVLKPTKTITEHKNVTKNNAYKWVTRDISLPLNWTS